RYAYPAHIRRSEGMRRYGDAPLSDGRLGTYRARDRRLSSGKRREASGPQQWKRQSCNRRKPEGREKWAGESPLAMARAGRLALTRTYAWAKQLASARYLTGFCGRIATVSSGVESGIDTKVIAALAAPAGSTTLRG